MMKTLAIIKSDYPLTKKQMKILRKSAQKRLGPKVRVLILSRDLSCRIETISE